MSKHEPCPVCGAQPKGWYYIADLGTCVGNSYEVSCCGLSASSENAWDCMCRAIHARALAGVRAKVEGLQVVTRIPITNREVIDKWAVLALLDNKEDLT